MPRSLNVVDYELHMEGGASFTFHVDVRRPAAPDSGDLPSWTALDYQRCDHCPLPATPGARCPAAVDVVPFVTPFLAMKSYDRARVVVRARDREIVKESDVQTALHSLLGVVMASSACPILRRLYGLAEHHLPFASPDEVSYRAAANHLLQQYFRRRRGEDVTMDLSGLQALYDDLGVLNRCFVERIRAASKMDGSLNALVLLFSVAALVRAGLDDDLELLEPLFAPRAS